MTAKIEYDSPFTDPDMIKMLSNMEGGLELLNNLLSLPLDQQHKILGEVLNYSAMDLLHHE